MTMNIQNITNTQNNPIKEYSTLIYIQKRVIDFCFVILLFIITSPIMLYSLYRIKKESSGTIFFKQSRVGKDEKAFTCYKFRSMHQGDKNFNHYTQDNDLRVFPYGKIMRKYRIDELPQLFNILKGDMHLIGPRAEWDILVKNYEKVIPNYHKRHVVKPGITGLAQVSYPYGCNIEDTKEKLKYDLEYIKEWSLKKEIAIIMKTIQVVIQKKGI